MRSRLRALVAVLPLALACRAAPSPDEPAALNVADGNGQTGSTGGVTAPPCYPDCEAHVPDAGPAESLPEQPVDHSAETPEPESCVGGPAPVIVASDPDDGFGDIALTATDVIWTQRDGIHRRVKGGDQPEVLLPLDRFPGNLVADGASVYWVDSPGLYTLPLDGGGSPTRLANDVYSPAAFAAHASSVFYFSLDPSSVELGNPCSGDVRLMAVPSAGGKAEVLAHGESTHSRPVVDATGVYWAADPPCVDDIDYRPPHYIRKFDFATRAVKEFATANGWPDDIRIAAGRVLWVDEGGIWSAPSDGSSAPVFIAQPPLVRGLATDGVRAYWAASARDGDSYSPNADVFMAPITGGAAEQIACQIYGIEGYAFFADEQAVYYRSWIRDLIARLPTGSE